MSWRTDIDAMPKGGLVEVPNNRPGAVMQIWEAPTLIVATKTGKVIATNWLPPGGIERRPVGRWRRMNTGEEPLAWMPWPTYP